MLTLGQKVRRSATNYRWMDRLFMQTQNQMTIKGFDA